MKNTNNIHAARKFTPGYFIREQMDLRQWSPNDLAMALGCTAAQIDELLQNRQPLSLAYARALAGAFGTSPEYWLNLSRGYQVWKTE